MTEQLARSAVDRAQSEIRQLILDGKYAAGARLKEEQLAETVGASRTPIREALLRLQAEGLVEFVTNRGAFVTEWTAEDLRSIYELRALLEGYGARLAALHAPASDIAALSVLAERMHDAWAKRRARAVDEISQLNNQFHRLLLQSGGNTRLEPMQRGLVQIPLVVRTFRRYTPEETERSLGHHSEIVEAVRARDPDWAQAVMSAHILAARQVLYAKASD